MRCYFNGELGVGTIINHAIPVQVTSACPLLTSTESLSLNKSELHVYPNPSNGVFSIRSEGGALRILDSRGKIIIDRWIEGPLNNCQLNHLDEGMYFLQLRNLEQFFFLRRIQRCI